ncbi:hypothetical protein ETAA8_56830 [Anatilimnocola aggregata]|uniref:Uncharacterized protein n=1 Tax=Anatilimnocola aggregata TaxID=2528021 RepID=A0A517YJY4_9BACT|nr:hypothetical protein ETAA8_56830 [Anatilimnocola aggregata]
MNALVLKGQVASGQCAIERTRPRASRVQHALLPAKIASVQRVLNRIAVRVATPVDKVAAIPDQTRAPMSAAQRDQHQRRANHLVVNRGRQPLPSDFRMPILATRISTTTTSTLLPQLSQPEQLPQQKSPLAGRVRVSPSVTHATVVRRGNSLSHAPAAIKFAAGGAEMNVPVLTAVEMTEEATIARLAIASPRKHVSPASGNEPVSVSVVARRVVRNLVPNSRAAKLLLRRELTRSARHATNSLLDQLNQKASNQRPLKQRCQQQSRQLPSQRPKQNALPHQLRTHRNLRLPAWG